MLFYGIIVILALGLVFMIRRPSDSGAKPSNPIGEAEICLAYGRKKEAKKILLDSLESQPEDAKARELLDSIK
tara:strand:- start:67719 stop:67937 length:219 start_codon:yes stop_codon:yes gene_type:complete